MMNYTRRWVVMLLTVIFFTAASSPLLAEMEISQIQGLMNEGKLDQALKETDTLLLKDKSNVQALFLKGLILTRMNQLPKAEEIFLQLTQNSPELPEPYNNLAVIYASRGEYDKAREALLKAINTHPTYATAHENIGDIYAKMASQAYNQALELDSGNVAAREKLSMVNELFSVPAASTAQLAAATPVPAPVVPATPEPEPVVTRTTAPAPSPAPAVPATKPESKPEPAPAPVAVAPTPAPTPAPVAAAPSPATAPSPVTTPAPEDDTLVTEAITNSVNGWARAWSDQDPDTYINWYAKDYTPGPDISRPDWEAQRRARLVSPRSIKVGISGLRVIRHGDEHAQASFVQDYQSDTYHDTVNKTLLFRLLNGRWLIVQEKSDS